MFVSRKTGWIGIDVGTSAVKVVQLKRRDAQLQVAAKAIVVRQEPWSSDGADPLEPTSSLEELQAARSLLGDISGHKAAALLSMAICGMHRFTGNLASTATPHTSIRQAIELETQKTASSLQYGYWSSSHESAESCFTNVLTTERSWTDCLYEDIRKMDWSCHAIDGLPMALGRAVQLIHPQEVQTPFAAIDLGYGKTTFCAIQNGIPVYVRALKGCGFQKLLLRICDELDVTTEEAQRLLQEYRVACVQPDTLSETEEFLGEMAQEFLEMLIQELTKTLSHLKFQLKSFAPRRTYLLGGGATMLGLASYLTQRLQSRFEVWNFGEEKRPSSFLDPVPNCLLGPAIALSALAWEQT